MPGRVCSVFVAPSVGFALLVSAGCQGCFLVTRRQAFSRNPSAIGIATAAVALLCSVLWGGNAVAIRFSIDDLPPIGMAGLRFALALVLMALWCRWRGIGYCVHRHQVPAIAIAGLLLFVQIALLNIGMQYTNSAHGTIFINTYPVFVAVFGWWLLSGESLSVRKLVGIAVAFVGMTVATGQPALENAREASPAANGRRAVGPPSEDGAKERDPGVRIATAGGSVRPKRDRVTLLGDLLVLASGAMLGLKTVYVKRVLTIIEPGKLLLWHYVVSVPMFFAVSLVVEGPQRYRFGVASALGVVYQGAVVAGFCFLVWTILLERHRASQLAVFSFTTPLFGIGISHLMRGDRITGSLIASGLAVALGVYVVATSAPEPAAPIGEGCGTEGTVSNSDGDSAPLNVRERS